MGGTQAFKTMDKSSWPQGEWTKEPDEVRWLDKDTGLPCVILRNTIGALCGYVGVSKSHPLFGVDYNEVDLSAHGGVNFSDNLDDSPGPLRDLWWFGFDCCHYRDFAPVQLAILKNSLPRNYRNIEYVKKECGSLAQQLYAISPAEMDGYSFNQWLKDSSPEQLDSFTLHS